MPSWKKVIISGSDATLNTVSASLGIQTSGDILPTTDNTLSLGSVTNRFQLNGGTPVTVDGSGTANVVTRFQGNTTVEDSKIFSSDTQTRLEHSNSGNSIFIVSGSNGQLLDVTDEIGDEIFRVNNGSGVELFTVSGSGNVKVVNDLIVSGDITGSALKLDSLGAENEIVIVGANTNVTSSNLLSIDTSNDRVGIGTSTPTVKLDIVGETSGEAQVRVAQHDNSGDGPDLRFFKSRGTAASPSAVNNDDYVGAVNAFVYDGSNYQQGGFFGFQAEGVDGDTTFGLRTRVGGTLSDRIAVDAAGDIDIAGSLTTGDSITIDDTDARLVLDRNAVSNDSEVVFTTNGTENWSIGTGQVGGDNDFTFRSYGSSNAIRFNQDGHINAQGDITGSNLLINSEITAPTITGSLLRLNENGTGMRITNVGGFEPQSGTFNIFGNDDVTFGAGGSGASHRVLTMYESDKSAHFANNVFVTGSLNVGDGTDINLVGGGNLETNGGNVNTSGGAINTNGGNVELGIGTLNGTIPGSAVNVDTVTATVKNFVIDHPTPEKEGYKLRHSSLEGPEIGVYFRGKSTSNIIDLPDYWVDLVEEESITVNLTPFGSPCQHYIEDIRDNQVIVGCACGTPNYHFTIYGERKDVEKLVVEYKEEKYL